MENPYQYSEHQPRPPYEMIRQMQSPQMGADYRLNNGMQPQRGGPPMPSHQYSGSNGYAHGSQLPPLHQHSRSSSGGEPPYGALPPQNRSQHASPVTHQLPFSPQYPQHASYSAAAPHYNLPTALPPYSQPYSFPNGPMPYHGQYTPHTAMPDYRTMTTTAHGQPIPAAMPAQGYSMSSTDDYSSRTHVVGAQGRRGILPSDEGRPPAIGPKATGKGAVVPQKDQNGKFPCPHCNKTYLHAKHLKRHLLRHTGDRPYQCVLCKDTFSRSDILKRHFQKCSIRRGNPTGATHLSSPSAYTNKKQRRRKDSTDGGPTGTSDSESAASTRQSTAEIPPYEQTQGAAADVGMTQMNGSVSMPTYGTNTLHSSPTTSPTTGRPPMGFYEHSSYPNQGYMN